MKFLSGFFILSLSFFSFSQDTLISKGDFKALVRNVRVEGSAKIYATPEGKNYVTLENFKIAGGIVLDLKVCGMIETGDSLCVSLGSPDRNTQSSFVIRYPFKQYSKVVIFDAELTQNLAEATQK